MESLANTRSAEFRKYQHLIRDLHVGGVIVTGHSLNGGMRNAEPYAMAALLNRLQKLARTPLFVAADFERGASMRVNSTTAWPYSMAFGAAQDLAAVTEEGADTARDARAMGVNWLFAPVADVNNNPDNPIINIRSFGENPAAGGQLRGSLHQRRAFGSQESGAGNREAFPRAWRHHRGQPSGAAAIGRGSRSNRSGGAARRSGARSQRAWTR